jgi:endonuclease YncB( thermonuclease family)
MRHDGVTSGQFVRIAFVIAGLIVLGFPFHGVRAAETAEPVPARVNRVIDGDSIDAQIDGRQAALGYLGAETPPLNQPCGREAAARNRELAGREILVVGDPAYEHDGRGRRLYYAYTADGTSIEAQLIQEGMARAVRTDAARGGELSQLEAAARVTHTGCLWQVAATARAPACGPPSWPPGIPGRRAVKRRALLTDAA